MNGSGRLLRYGVSFLACAGLLWLINWPEFLQTLKLANEYWLALALVLILSDRVFMVYKWTLLLQGSGLSVSLRMALRSYFVGAFAEAFLPTSIGGDIVRVTWLSRHIANSGKVIASVIIERLLGAIALATVAVASTVLLARHLAGAWSELMVVLGAILAISLTGIAVMFSHAGHSLMKPLIAAIPFRGLSAVAETARAGVLEFRTKPMLLGTFLFLSVCEQAFPIVANVVIARAFSIGLSFEWAMIGMPIILAASRMPISIASFGVSEGLYALVFSYAGIPVTQSVMMAVAGRLLVLLSSLPGVWWTATISKEQLAQLAIGRESDSERAGGSI